MNEAELLLSNILSLGNWATWKKSIDQVADCLQAWELNTSEIHFRRICLVGCGSSYYAGQVGKYILEKITHLPTTAEQAFSFTHYFESGLFTRDTLVVGLSTTGKTTATSDALAIAQKNGATTLAITAVPDSLITDVAADSIFTGGRVNVIVQTETYVQSLIAIYLLALRIGDKESPITNQQKTYWENQFSKAHEISQQFLDLHHAKIISLVDKYSNLNNIFVLGTGPNLGTAEEAALKVIEMAKIYSDGSEMEDFFHGKDRELAQGSAVIFLSPYNQVSERMFDFLAFTRQVGVPSIVIACQETPELKRLADDVIILKGELDELTTPLVYITPIYLFSYHLAFKRGFDPIARRFPMSALQVQYKGSEFDLTEKEE